jgi:Protein of unknown function (DUF3349)
VEETIMMTMPPVLQSIVDWLRAGYPDGVPPNDYIPLLALLARRLTADEVAAVTAELSRDGDEAVDNTEIGLLITKITSELPRAEDVARVRDRLSATGPFL